MRISGTANGTVTLRRPAVSTALFAVCASFVCEAGEFVAPPARETRADAVPDAASSTKRSGSSAQSRAHSPRGPLPLTMTRELFDQKSWDTPNVVAATPQQESRPASAPFRYQYIGRMEVEGRPTVHLSKDDKLYPVGVGDVLDGTFRVESIKADGLEVTYLPQKRKQFVAFSAIVPPPPQGSVAARPEVLRRQQPMAPSAAPAPVFPAPPDAPSSSGSSVATTPAAGSPGNTPPVAESAATTQGVPGGGTPSVGSVPVAPSIAPTGEPATAGTAMPISPPAAEMPVGPPTVSTMPTLPPQGDMSVTPPSDASMATTPPSGGM
jgi:hypothetical protein